MRFLTFLFIIAVLMSPHKAMGQGCYRLVFWNVENLFDIMDDTTRNDEAFTPAGDNHWTMERYNKKLSMICKTLVALGEDGGSGSGMPMLIGMAEVENDKVLRDLCRGTPLRRYRYDFVHFDSPDRRGIDNALLFRRKEFTPFLSKTVYVSDTSNGFFTRDILLVGGVTRTGDSLFVLVNHFPSKRGGMEAERRRELVARRLRTVMDSIRMLYPSAAVVAMGDFNASPNDREIAECLMRHNDGCYINLMEKMEHGKGSYKYQDNWSFIDQIIVAAGMMDGRCGLKVKDGEAHLFDAQFLLLDDEKYLGKKLFRTYQGQKYLGGYSDHLPVYVDLSL